MKVGIVVFPGSNCDRDIHHVLSDVFNLDAQYYWHKKGLPDNIDAIVIPGGFTYGDRLRAGAIASHSPVIQHIQRLSEKGIPVLGICNGFQILTESGLLPGVLLKNESLNFMCRWTSLIVENNTTSFTNSFKPQETLSIPIANGEGRYYTDKQTMKKLEKNNQIVFRYTKDVNGSMGGIAGVCNSDGNVVGMMPHPERAAEPEINPGDSGTSSLIFESLLTSMGASNGS